MQDCDGKCEMLMSVQHQECIINFISCPTFHLITPAYSAKLKEKPCFVLFLL